MITLDDVARVCHEANRAYCEAIGDFSQVSWEDAPEWQRESARNGVRYHQANPNSTPADSHMNWKAEKEAQGWQYGEVKDADAKTHPCIVPYEQLPVEQRAKDYIFLGIVRSFK